MVCAKFLHLSSHVLLLLLVLEFYILSIIVRLVAASPIAAALIPFLIFFSLAVIEASLGLGLLINMTRISSSLNIKSV
jgi:NADH:ubiquinone oxidoreductase subunit K